MAAFRFRGQPVSTGETKSVRERNTKKFAIAPDQPTLADSAKIIEGQIKVQWDRQILCANTGANVCNVCDAARAHASVSAKE
jgi:hypothetical protein